MANNKYDANSIRNERAKYMSFVREAQINCDHRNGHNPTLESVDTSKSFIGKKEFYPNGYVCKQCNDIFSLESLTATDINEHLAALYSMCNQAKLLFNPSESDYEQIKGIMQYLDEIQQVFMPYYLNHVKELTNNRRNNNNNNQNRAKGRIGVGPVSYSGR